MRAFVSTAIAAVSLAIKIQQDCKDEITEGRCADAVLDIEANVANCQYWIKSNTCSAEKKCEISLKIENDDSSEVVKGNCGEIAEQYGINHTKEDFERFRCDYGFEVEDCLDDAMILGYNDQECKRRRKVDCKNETLWCMVDGIAEDGQEYSGTCKEMAEHVFEALK